MLVERQRHVQVVHPFTPDDVVRLGQRAEQRNAAVADVIAQAVVEEADDLEAQLAVLEDLVGDDPAEIPAEFVVFRFSQYAGGGA